MIPQNVEDISLNREGTRGIAKLVPYTLEGKFWVISLLGFFFTSAVYLGVPWLRKPLVRENNLLELLTATLFIVTFLLAIRLLMKWPAANSPKVYWSIPFLGLVGFLEETSFGHSFLYYEVPEIDGVKIDAVHDFLKVFVQGMQKDPISWPILGSAIAMSMVVLFSVFRWRLYDFKIYSNLLVTYPPVKFVGLCIGFLGVATVMDLEWLSHHYWVFVEEYLEAVGSLALLFAYLTMKQDSAIR